VGLFAGASLFMKCSLGILYTIRKIFSQLTFQCLRFVQLIVATGYHANPRSSFAPVLRHLRRNPRTTPPPPAHLSEPKPPPTHHTRAPPVASAGAPPPGAGLEPESSPACLSFSRRRPWPWAELRRAPLPVDKAPKIVVQHF
jgi:hypothetical protein